MPQDLIRYDLLVQDALKGVVRKVLTDAAEKGLPGDHHFYVSFRTGEPGLRMSQRLRDKYPEEMTIILQHQFWDLAVTEHAFEVGLSFSGVPERLLVPFDAVSGFFDPSVQFGLKFELSGAEPADNDEDDEEPEEAASAPTPLPLPLPLPTRNEPPARESARNAAARAKGEAAKEEAAKSEAAEGNRAPGEAEAKPKGAAKKSAKDKAAAADTPSAEVVSLDAFRKKP